MKSAGVAAASLAAGGLTSVAQGVLPDPVRPFANSVSGWTALTALIVWGFGERLAASAVFGALSFVGLVLGYVTASTARGYPSDETLFTLAGIVAGPFVGAAASALHRKGLLPALGAGLLSGIGLGEGAYGLTVILATTGWFYWALVSAVALVLLVLVLLRRAPDLSSVLAGTSLAAVTAVAFLLTYSGLA